MGLIYGKRRERKYLESLGQYKLDKASEELVRVNNYGMRQDLLNHKLSFLQQTFGAQSLLDNQQEGYQSSQQTLMMLLGAGALVLVLLVVLVVRGI